MRKADVRIRVTAQLIEADTGYHLWSDTYDRELDDIFAIQDEISAAIVSALSDTLGLQVDSAPPVKAAASSEAYNLFLLAQHQVQKRTKIDLESAIPNYERALDLDPNYAPAHAGVGLAWFLLTASDATYGTLTLQESLAESMPHIEKALHLDGELPEALGVMGLTLDARERYEEALPYYEKALALNPSLTDIRNWYSQALSSLGRAEESLQQMEKAYEADPLSLLTMSNYTNELMQRRRFDTLEPVLDRLTQLDPSRGAGFKGWMFVTQGRAAEGVEQQLRALEFDSTSLSSRTQAAWSLWNLGHREAGVSIWPFPDNLYDLVSFGTDFEYILELAQKKFSENPGEPGGLEDLAWAHWDVGNKEEAARLATQYLDSLGETRRPIDGMNMLFVLEARRRGDEEAMLARLGPVEARFDQALESGIDFFWLHIMKAIVVDIRGERALALEHLEKATTRSIMPVERLTYTYEVMGWDEDPAFAPLREHHREYTLTEAGKLLAVACGPDGFEAWQPSATECGKAPSPN